MANIALNRTVTAMVTNKSGGSLGQGDVVIVDSSTANSVTTTTTGGYKNGKVVVVLEPNGIANNATGLVVLEGWAPKVNLNASASLGDLIKTHTVAKQAAPHAAPFAAGDFGQVLGTGTSPAAIIFGSVEQGAAAGGTASAIQSNTTALSTSEGALRWDSTRKAIILYDAQRERGITPIGWMPFAYPINLPLDGSISAFAMAANGGSVAQPIMLTAPMLLQSVSIWSTDAATARTWGWDLYEQYLNNGNAGENTLTRVANSTADESFTPVAASTRTVAAASAPVFLPPGLYWLVIQNRHASNNFGLGGIALSNFAPNFGQTKTTTNPNGATLDLVAATWSKIGSPRLMRLNGRVFGETTAF